MKRESIGLAHRRRAEDNYRRLLRIARELADTFADRDPVESVFVLRRAAAIIQWRRNVMGTVLKRVSLPGEPLRLEEHGVNLKARAACEGVD